MMTSIRARSSVLGAKLLEWTKENKPPSRRKRRNDIVIGKLNSTDCEQYPSREGVESNKSMTMMEEPVKRKKIVLIKHEIPVVYEHIVVSSFVAFSSFS